ncbi:hypothetical protein ACO22_03972 [Paracoccidioides brasiliensis]|uniref:Vacuolar import and degradation protein-domain-containing protein n=1 Tax=Paracoccidioides brasiliensis TaxID=121759 RepID=A0A1D2JEF3_PARBR|nr:hypothetical protein ACO22_03972 [Paracoccidioides brasiliensis]
MNVPEDDVNDNSVSFLRTHMPSSLDSSPGRVRSRRHQLQPLEDELNSNMDPSYHPRPPAAVGVSSRIPIVRPQRDVFNGAANYETRSRSSTSIYAWAQGSDYEAEEDPSVDPPDPIQDRWEGRLQRARRTSSRSPGQRREGSTRSPRLWTANPDGELGEPSRYGRSDLATATLLQSVRHHPRFSSRTRTLQTFILDRERSGHVSEEREWQPPVTAPTMNTSLSTLPPNSHSAVNRGDIPRTISASELRDAYSEDRPVDRLEETIKYLDRIRFSNSYNERVQVTTAGNFVQYEYLRRNEDDFILDTCSIVGPSDSSWLRPGMVFEGSQHATNQCDRLGINPHQRPRSHQDLDPVIVSGGELGRRNVHTSSEGRSSGLDGLYEFGNGDSTGASSHINSSSSSSHEHWPVKVTIHHVDYNTMTLSGTMEAYNIPDKTSNSQGTHITTFLEGEIIDFNTHSLETKNFKANVEVDSRYWRELEPFKYLSYIEIVKNLVSKKWVTEKLAKGWILMRWKERCFITPSHSRQGLTISGFYYISIRRSDGHIEGMYYDPGSSPYQHLSLDPQTRHRMIFPAYGFR